ncbi:hypothetical protein MUS1_10615 [Marinomonas ushuaiensis DSM 15871]|uniref:Uncharacterized protein n=1 Tax=Marinomonas ushuaiensis DSM 15871 TaxID=1122207 RepID=X7E651_9GAMM|nr:hypothetical protein MUS1_10615 [Marinomonas ushuaiensis DSM 15871]
MVKTAFSVSDCGRSSLIMTLFLCLAGIRTLTAAASTEKSAVKASLKYFRLR